HTDPKDRPKSVFGKQVTLHTGPKHQSHLLLPVIPVKGKARKKVDMEIGMSTFSIVLSLTTASS
ncbi:MAG: hypothetical protein O7F69_05760, partial [Alphaproteobacteria bacterium]|nr:hypothetical protein [Alphaproteobacteria bacterium]